MSNTERLLQPLGLSSNEFFKNDTLLLFREEDRNPFGFLKLQNGRAVLRVGKDFDVQGIPVRIHES